jgi:hypothetical protein
VSALDVQEYGYNLVAGPSHYYLWIWGDDPIQVDYGVEACA